MTGPREQELSENAYAVLGLLTFGERSGYDLLKLAKEALRDVIPVPSKTQVYAELRHLADLGYARQRKVVQEDRPDKRVYAITHRGEAALREWLETSDPPPTGGVARLQLMFGRHMSPALLRDRVERMGDGARTEIERLRGHGARLRADEHGFFPSVLIDGRIAELEACASWALRVLTLLDEQQEVWRRP